MNGEPRGWARRVGHVWRRAGLGTSFPCLLAAAACGIGLVDLPEAEPSPTRIFIQTRLLPDEDDVARVELEFHAALDPGITPDGEVRQVRNDRLGVDLVDLAPSGTGPPRSLLWRLLETYPSPGPGTLSLRFPEVDGTPSPADRDVPVGVGVSPADSVLLADTEDLVLLLDAPLAVPESASWDLHLTSASGPGFRVSVSAFGGPWPHEIRVPSSQLPRSEFPLDAALEVRWSDPIGAANMSVPDSYGVDVRSVVVVHRKVVAR